jgi:hypothetical protein
VSAPAPESVKRLQDFFIVYFHEEPDDDAAILSALRDLDDRDRQRHELSKAFGDMLAADVEPGYWTGFVRRFANRAATSDEQARDFVERIRLNTALDDVFEELDE